MKTSTHDIQRDSRAYAVASKTAVRGKGKRGLFQKFLQRFREPEGIYWKEQQAKAGVPGTGNESTRVRQTIRRCYCIVLSYSGVDTAISVTLIRDLG
jgi:hypothetical protein